MGPCRWRTDTKDPASANQQLARQCSSAQPAISCCGNVLASVSPVGAEYLSYNEAGVGVGNPSDPLLAKSEGARFVEWLHSPVPPRRCGFRVLVQTRPGFVL
jgi:hypothetical protein